MGSNADLYLAAANTREKRRGVERFLAWRLVSGRPVPPPESVSESEAIEFAGWMSDERSADEIRYATIMLRNRGDAEVYRMIVRGQQPVDRPALSRMLRTYSRWIGRQGNRIVAKPAQTSPEAALTYCAWLSMVWSSFGCANPWPAAREAIGTGRIRKNSNSDAVSAGIQRALETTNPTTLGGARDAWLVCGVLLLGLSTKEIAAASRKDIFRESWGDALSTDRTSAWDIAIGPTAAGYLHRMEGHIEHLSAKSDRARLLHSDAPLWPSLTRGGIKSDTDRMSEATVSRILRQMGIRVSDLRQLLRSELRGHGATIKQAGVLMGTRSDASVDRTPGDWAGYRLQAQMSISDKVGL